MIIRFLFYLIVTVYLVLVIIRNNQIINFDLIFRKFNVSLFLLILVSLLLGLLLASFQFIKSIWKLRKEIKGLKKIKNEK
ncbi:MAG: lipopolysaccharide assembly protein LapA domain-containing protein [bacterium]|nr:lipopolysaccharide assembly protein LapA domain-containing protein [bacterium]